MAIVYLLRPARRERALDQLSRAVALAEAIREPGSGARPYLRTLAGEIAALVSSARAELADPDQDAS